MRILRSVSLFVLATTALSAHAALFDFESTSYNVGYTSLLQSSGGLNLTLSRQNGASFDVSDLSGFQTAYGVPASYGTHTVGGFNDTRSAYVGNFSSAVGGVSVDVGDFGADADSLVLSIYSGLNGTGSLLGSSSVILPGNFSSQFTGLTVSAMGGSAMSFVLSGDPTAAFPVSVFLDNVRTSAVPGPMAALPFALMALRRRKRA